MLPVKFAVNTKKNNVYINGKYSSLPNWSRTIALILANKLSKAIDHLDGIKLFSLSA